MKRNASRIKVLGSAPRAKSAFGTFWRWTIFFAADTLPHAHSPVWKFRTLTTYSVGRVIRDGSWWRRVLRFKCDTLLLLLLRRVIYNKTGPKNVWILLLHADSQPAEQTAPLAAGENGSRSCACKRFDSPRKARERERERWDMWWRQLSFYLLQTPVGVVKLLLALPFSCFMFKLIQLF